MTNIHITRGLRWQTLAFLLLMSAGSTVALAQGWGPGNRGQSSQRDSGNRQQQASGRSWRDTVRQQRRDSSRQNRQGSQSRRDGNRQSQQQSRQGDDRQSRRDNRGDRPRDGQRGSNDGSRRGQTWADAVRQSREERRQGRGESRRDSNRGNRDQRHRRDRNHREQAFYNYRRRGNHRRRHHSIGHKVRRLPRNHSRFLWNSYPYFYGGGYFYRPSNVGYVVVDAPFGFRLSVLPVGYATFYLDRHRYHYVNDTYYRWYEDTRDYEVVDEPEGATDALYRVSEIAAASLYIYPTQGQSEDQRDQDRFECHLWAVDESEFDPSYSDPDKAGYENYRRAITACLEGRGYSVK